MHSLKLKTTISNKCEGERKNSHQRNRMDVVAAVYIETHNQLRMYFHLMRLAWRHVNRDRLLVVQRTPVAMESRSQLTLKFTFIRFDKNNPE